MDNNIKLGALMPVTSAEEARIVKIWANPFPFPTKIPVGFGYSSMNESEPCTIGILVEKADGLAETFFSILPKIKVLLTFNLLPFNFSSLLSLFFNIFCPIILINFQNS